jgi:hypothetical protein
MHIPACPTSEMEVLGFQEALAQSLLPGADYDADKWLYVPGTYQEYRYLLGTRGQRPLICVGVNPSTAQPGALDPTLKSVERVALFNGFDSFLMFNVYAQRATRPGDMERELNQRLHRENLAAFAYALSLTPEPTVWCAWGTVIEQRDYLPRCVKDLADVGRRYNARWVTAGKRSKKGHPHHPLYLRKDSILEDFDIEQYVSAFPR